MNSFLRNLKSINIPTIKYVSQKVTPSLSTIENTKRNSSNEVFQYSPIRSRSLPPNLSPFKATLEQFRPKTFNDKSITKTKPKFQKLVNQPTFKTANKFKKNFGQKIRKPQEKPKSQQNIRDVNCQVPCIKPEIDGPNKKSLLSPAARNLHTSSSPLLQKPSSFGTFKDFYKKSPIKALLNLNEEAKINSTSANFIKRSPGKDKVKFHYLAENTECKQCMSKNKKRIAEFYRVNQDKFNLFAQKKRYFSSYIHDPMQSNQNKPTEVVVVKDQNLSADNPASALTLFSLIKLQSSKHPAKFVPTNLYKFEAKKKCEAYEFLPEESSTFYDPYPLEMFREDYIQDTIPAESIAKKVASCPDLIENNLEVVANQHLTTIKPRDKDMFKKLYEITPCGANLNDNDPTNVATNRYQRKFKKLRVKVYKNMMLDSDKRMSRKEDKCKKDKSKNIEPRELRNPVQDPAIISEDNGDVLKYSGLSLAMMKIVDDDGSGRKRLPCKLSKTKHDSTKDHLCAKDDCNYNKKEKDASKIDLDYIKIKPIYGFIDAKAQPISADVDEKMVKDDAENIELQKLEVPSVRQDINENDINKYWTDNLLNKNREKIVANNRFKEIFKSRNEKYKELMLAKQTQEGEGKGLSIIGQTQKENSTFFTYPKDSLNEKICESLNTLPKVELGEQSKQIIASAIKQMIEPIIEKEFLKYEEVKYALERMEKRLTDTLKTLKPSFVESRKRDYKFIKYPWQKVRIGEQSKSPEMVDPLEQALDKRDPVSRIVIRTPAWSRTDLQDEPRKHMKYFSNKNICDDEAEKILKKSKKVDFFAELSQKRKQLKAEADCESSEKVELCKQKAELEGGTVNCEKSFKKDREDVCMPKAAPCTKANDIPMSVLKCGKCPQTPKLKEWPPSCSKNDDTALPTKPVCGCDEQKCPEVKPVQCIQTPCQKCKPSVEPFNPCSKKVACPEASVEKPTKHGMEGMKEIMKPDVTKNEPCPCCEEPVTETFIRVPKPISKEANAIPKKHQEATDCEVKNRYCDSETLDIEQEQRKKLEEMQEEILKRQKTTTCNKAVIFKKETKKDWQAVPIDANKMNDKKTIKRKPDKCKSDTSNKQNPSSEPPKSGKSAKAASNQYQMLGAPTTISHDQTLVESCTNKISDLCMMIVRKNKSGLKAAPIVVTLSRSQPVIGKFGVSSAMSIAGASDGNDGNRKKPTADILDFSNLNLFNKNESNKDKGIFGWALGSKSRIHEEKPERFLNMKDCSLSGKYPQIEPSTDLNQIANKVLCKSNKNDCHDKKKNPKITGNTDSSAKQKKDPCADKGSLKDPKIKKLNDCIKKIQSETLIVDEKSNGKGKKPKEDPCKKKEDDPCKKTKGDSSAKKEDPCKKTKEDDPCKNFNKDSNPAAKQKKDPCAAKGSTQDPKIKKLNDCIKKRQSKPIIVEEKSEGLRKKPKDESSKKKQDDPCNKPKEDPCKKKEEDPCKKPKEDPCLKKEEDPCKKPKEDPSNKKEEDSCKKPKEDPCKKKEEDPCKKPKEDPSKKKEEDPCKKPREDPCKKKEEDPCKKPTEGLSKKKKSKPISCTSKTDVCKKKKSETFKKKSASEHKLDPCIPCKYEDYTKKSEKSMAKTKSEPCIPCKYEDYSKKTKADPGKKDSSKGKTLADCIDKKQSKDVTCYQPKSSKSKFDDPCQKLKDDPSKSKQKKDPCGSAQDKKSQANNFSSGKKPNEDPCKKSKQTAQFMKKKDEFCKDKEEDPCKPKKDPRKKNDDPCKPKKEDPGKKKGDPCESKEEDPCKKKDDPCKPKKEDTDKKKGDPCKPKGEDPCKKKDHPGKKEDPGKKNDDPCKTKKEDPCKKLDDKKDDPCKPKKEDKKDDKKDDPCKKKDDPSKSDKKEDPCKKKQDDPCKKSTGKFADCKAILSGRLIKVHRCDDAMNKPIETGNAKKLHFKDKYPWILMKKSKECLLTKASQCKPKKGHDKMDFFGSKTQSDPCLKYRKSKEDASCPIKNKLLKKFDMELNKKPGSKEDPCQNMTSVFAKDVPVMLTNQINYDRSAAYNQHKTTLGIIYNKTFIKVGDLCTAENGKGFHTSSKVGKSKSASLSGKTHQCEGSGSKSTHNCGYDASKSSGASKNQKVQSNEKSTCDSLFPNRSKVDSTMGIIEFCKQKLIQLEKQEVECMREEVKENNYQKEAPTKENSENLKQQTQIERESVREPNTSQMSAAKDVLDCFQSCKEGSTLEEINRPDFSSVTGDEYRALAMRLNKELERQLDVASCDYENTNSKISKPDSDLEAPKYHQELPKWCTHKETKSIKQQSISKPSIDCLKEKSTKDKDLEVPQKAGSDTTSPLIDCLKKCSKKNNNSKRAEILLNENVSKGSTLKNEESIFIDCQKKVKASSKKPEDAKDFCKKPRDDTSKTKEESKKDFCASVGSSQDPKIRILNECIKKILKKTVLSDQKDNHSSKLKEDSSKKPKDAKDSCKKPEDAASKAKEDSIKDSCVSISSSQDPKILKLNESIKKILKQAVISDQKDNNNIKLKESSSKKSEDAKDFCKNPADKASKANEKSKKDISASIGSSQDPEIRKLTECISKILKQAVIGDQKDNHNIKLKEGSSKKSKDAKDFCKNPADDASKANEKSKKDICTSIGSSQDPEIWKLTECIKKILKQAVISNQKDNHNIKLKEGSSKKSKDAKDFCKNPADDAISANEKSKKDVCDSIGSSQDPEIRKMTECIKKIFKQAVISDQKDNHSIKLKDDSSKKSGQSAEFMQKKGEFCKDRHKPKEKDTCEKSKQNSQIIERKDDLCKEKPCKPKRESVSTKSEQSAQRTKQKGDPCEPKKEDSSEKSEQRVQLMKKDDEIHQIKSLETLNEEISEKMKKRAADYCQPCTNKTRKKKTRVISLKGIKTKNKKKPKKNEEKKLVETKNTSQSLQTCEGSQKRPSEIQGNKPSLCNEKETFLPKAAVRNVKCTEKMKSETSISDLLCNKRSKSDGSGGEQNPLLICKATCNTYSENLQNNIVTKTKEKSCSSSNEGQSSRNSSKPSSSGNLLQKSSSQTTSGKSCSKSTSPTALKADCSKWAKPGRLTSISEAQGLDHYQETCAKVKVNSAKNGNLKLNLEQHKATAGSSVKNYLMLKCHPVLTDLSQCKEVAQKSSASIKKDCQEESATRHKHTENFLNVKCESVARDVPRKESQKSNTARRKAVENSLKVKCVTASSDISQRKDVAQKSTDGKNQDCQKTSDAGQKSPEEFLKLKCAPASSDISRCGEAAQKSSDFRLNNWPEKNAQKSPSINHCLQSAATEPTKDFRLKHSDSTSTKHREAARKSNVDMDQYFQEASTKDYLELKCDPISVDMSECKEVTQKAIPEQGRLSEAKESAKFRKEYLQLESIREDQIKPVVESKTSNCPVSVKLHDAKSPDDYLQLKCPNDEPSSSYKHYLRPRCPSKIPRRIIDKCSSLRSKSTCENLPQKMCSGEVKKCNSINFGNGKYFMVDKKDNGMPTNQTGTYPEIDGSYICSMMPLEDLNPYADVSKPKIDLLCDPPTIFNVAEAPVVLAKEYLCPKLLQEDDNGQKDFCVDPEMKPKHCSLHKGIKNLTVGYDEIEHARDVGLLRESMLITRRKLNPVTTTATEEEVKELLLRNNTFIAKVQKLGLGEKLVCTCDKNGKLVDEYGEKDFDEDGVERIVKCALVNGKFNETKLVCVEILSDEELHKLEEQQSKRTVEGRQVKIPLVKVISNKLFCRENSTGKGFTCEMMTVEEIRVPRKKTKDIKKPTRKVLSYIELMEISRERDHNMK